MSYTQRFYDSIQVSGSTSVSYPASQKGGTIHVPYSKNVSFDITIDVETDSFDSSVVHCNRSIDLLTGSVVAMNTAQCAAIQQTAKDVSRSLINGFFGTIRMELSQQLQALDSAIKAGFGLIAEQGKAVSEQKKTLETDYNRISSRYLAIFRNLDDECHKRIYALDRDSFNLSRNVQKKLLMETGANISAKNLLCIEDESSSRSMITVSRVNRLAREVLKTLRNYIEQETAIAALVGSFIFDEPAAGKVTQYVPVVWTSGENPESDESGADCYMPEAMPQAQRELVAAAVNRRFAAAESGRAALPEHEKTALDREFKAIAESVFGESIGEKDTRIYSTLMELWQNSSLYSIKGAVQ
ncbi:MAG: hypothetical protein LBE17_03645 [Treponema sp.]|jgi:hypothetical protein|nr:hypothetical protein [Treponema sp.]